MPTLDLDAARAAREEVAKPEEAPAVEFGGERYTLPLELPFGVFMRMASLKKDPAQGLEAMTDLLTSLFGDRTDEFLAAGPSLSDLLVLLEHLTDVYGVDVGEAEASPTS